MTPNARFHPSLGGWSLLALALGTALGLVGRAADLHGVQLLSELVSPLGALWMNALQMTVVPLLVAQLLSAMVRPSGTTTVAGLGGRSLALFLVLLVGGGLLTIVGTHQALGFLTPPPNLLESLKTLAIPAAMREASTSGPVGFSEWLVGMVPRYPLEAAVNGDILQILIFTVLIGVAVGRLPEEQRDPLAKVFRSLADAMLILVSWVVWGTPVGVFSIMLALSLGTGLGVVGVVALYFVLVCIALLLITAVLYPVAVFFGRTSILRFARAALPAQIVAASTQSSLASLPALIEGGRKELDLPDSSTGFVLPLCVSAFKMNQAVSPVVKAMFLAHFFGVSLSVPELTSFMVGTILIGFTSAGIPRGSAGFSRLPLYLAIGIPIEGYLMLEAVKQTPIYDACATVLNVTGDMAAATLLSRGERSTVGS
ncbi:MAG: dicarboxylate/amino acid:cation symporter [Longimicrobiales bacterium]|nr:dicarboxylate/amino acid:cation symporter [Longimicrobiales bacterium]